MRFEDDGLVYSHWHHRCGLREPLPRARSSKLGPPLRIDHDEALLGSSSHEKVLCPASRRRPADHVSDWRLDRAPRRHRLAVEDEPAVLRASPCASPPDPSPQRSSRGGAKIASLYVSGRQPPPRLAGSHFSRRRRRKLARAPGSRPRPAPASAARKPTWSAPVSAAPRSVIAIPSGIPRVVMRERLRAIAAASRKNSRCSSASRNV